jgi:MFS family permease
MTAESAAGAPGRSRGKAASGAATAAPASSLPSSRVAYYTVFLLILSLTSLQLDTNIVPYVAAKIKADLHISDTDLGLLLGLSFGLFYTLVGIPIAWLIDRFSRKWIIAIGIATWSLGTALCGMAQSYGQLFFARFVVGAGEAGNGPASYSVLADLFPREKMTRAVAFMQLGSVIGPALALLIGALILKVFLEMSPMSMPWGPLRGWQMVLILVGLPGLLVSALFIFTMKEPVRRSIRGQVDGEAQASSGGLGTMLIAPVVDYGIAFRYMARHWRVFGPMFGALFVGAMRIGAQQWQPIFYQRTFGWKPPQVALLNGLAQLIAMPVFLVIGVVLAERLVARGKSDAAIRVQIIGSLMALPGAFAFLMPTPWLAYGFSILSYAAIGVAAPSQNAALQIVCPAAMRGKITSLFLFLYSVVGIALSPILTGFITDHVFHAENMIKWSIFVPLIVLNPIAVVLVWLGLKPYGREVERLKALEASGGA